MDQGSDLEARSRLLSLLDVNEHEAAQLRRLMDPRLSEVIDALTRLQAEIVAALSAFPEPPQNGA